MLCCSPIDVSLAFFSYIRGTALLKKTKFSNWFSLNLPYKEAVGGKGGSPQGSQALLHKRKLSVAPLVSPRGDRSKSYPTWPQAPKKLLRVARCISSGKTWMMHSIRYSWAIGSRQDTTCSRTPGRTTRWYLAKNH